VRPQKGQTQVTAGARDPFDLDKVANPRSSSAIAHISTSKVWSKTVGRT